MTYPTPLPFFSARGTDAPAPRTEMFPFRGGPYDGENMPVEVDDAGVPVEMRTVDDLTAPDMAINPAFGHQSDRLVALYERVDALGPDGIGYVYEFRSQTRLDLNRNVA